jgi:hypothetical protein
MDKDGAKERAAGEELNGLLSDETLTLSVEEVALQRMSTDRRFAIQYSGQTSSSEIVDEHRRRVC